MNLTEAMKKRHSVRQYTDRPLSAEAVSALRDEIDACNQEGGLHIQLAMNELKVFDSFMAHYGKLFFHYPGFIFRQQEPFCNLLYCLCQKDT